MKFEVFKFDNVESTNILAHDLAKKGHKNFLVLANTQTNGKGRLNRVWVSEEGGLYLSIVLDISNFEKLEHSNFVASLSVLTTLKEFSTNINDFNDLKYSIKWPNDILVNNHKICGILSELNFNENYIVIGIGVNLNNSIYKVNKLNNKNNANNNTNNKNNKNNKSVYNAISLNQLFNTKKYNNDENNMNNNLINKDLFLSRLLSNFNNYLNMNSSELLEVYNNNSETLNKDVKIILNDKEITGKVINIDYNGLYLDTNSELGVILIEVGDCIHLR
ncbi:biotin--[acetyl-CoA-carboxylase] ligase [Methanococcus voltae]|uniref:Biotin/acetyl-CoA-carboxylase ligase n=1 Tax=Methanococcus voltae (strain ATCC BAA-1334 / A3) TaxID=456320 RepID=D7DQN9_METV3|nr:biotin--[acetyl-CoA-carboxylase] ligase [Methanococcus voltae]MCS3901972.1 BirA family biotin operon repressor/biotin-[acetyl-CoA-carboxylase] ligase [Methanococcus voltae]